MMRPSEAHLCFSAKPGSTDPAFASRSQRNTGYTIRQLMNIYRERYTIREVI